MRITACVVGVALIVSIIWEAFEALVLPRRVSRRVRFSRFFFLTLWPTWQAVARAVFRAPTRRQAFLALFGPLSLLLLLTLWASGLVLAFAIVQWGLGSAMHVPDGPVTFLTDLYMSGTTFFTLGLGDVSPRSAPARLVTVVEAGMGFGFLAIVTAYLPVLYQGFSRREATIVLLDARAGSPPSAGELLRRHGDGESGALEGLLRDWERWAAELLESHISYPVLAYYRSQHSNQSWLAALTTILDACALLLTIVRNGPTRQAQLTFAIARHAVVDLSQIFSTAPRAPEADRLPPSDFIRLREMLAHVGYRLGSAEDEARLGELRRGYETYANALSRYLRLPLPPWIPAARPDNWETSAWEHPRKSDSHF